MEPPGSNLCEHIIEEHSLPKIFEQLDFALEFIGARSVHAGEEIRVPILELEAYIGTFSDKTIDFCLKGLEDNGLIDFRMIDRQPSSKAGAARLTLRGWSRFEEISRGKSDSQKVFMAMKFGDTVLDKMFKDYFKPAIAQTGFSLFRLDDRPVAGLIDIRMRQEIMTSKFVVADLTHDNYGAYWEAGFAEGANKKVIFTCEKNKFLTVKTHFDVNHLLTVLWEEADPSQAVEQLKLAVRYTFPDAKQND